MGRNFFVVGDPHFREGCVREMDIFIDEVLRVISENLEDLDFIVVLGDVMDRHGILHQKPFHQACRFLIELSKRRPTYCLIGNHDFDIPSKYLPENHPFKIMTWTTVPNLTIVDRPMIVEGNMFMTPYVPPGMFQRAVNEAFGVCVSEDPWKTLGDRGVHLVFAHQEFRGCQMGRMTSETGDIWPNTPAFSETPLVISGHIHDYQMLGENIIYVGTPIQVNYGEGAKRGICLVNFDRERKIRDLNWFPIHVPRKLTKTIQIDSLDGWVSSRFDEMCKRYKTVEEETPGKEDKKRCKKTFETIGRLLALNKQPFMEDLRRKINEDRHVDNLRVYVALSGKVSGTVIKSTILRIKELPIGVQQVFTIENQDSKNMDSKNGDGSPDGGVDEERKTSWMDVLKERIGENDKKKRLLTELLNDLSGDIEANSNR